jgi:uncharacterized protein (UPF0332 family)
MPFDWSAYRTVAQTLKENTDEASHRSAVSRAYYFAYHQALNHLAEHHGFLFSESRPAHDQVWREFEHRGMTYREVWYKGDKLKKMRVNADYRTAVVVSAEIAVASLNLADRIGECLKQMHEKLSAGKS